MKAHVLAFSVVLAALVSRDAAAGGSSHVRLRTDNGPVHVWKPAKYDAATAGVVLYVHGYFTGVDRAWRQHHLARQFAESGLNAVFIACEAPIGATDRIRWPSVGELLDTVDARIDGGLPNGRVVAVGHSGAHRTLTEWVLEDRLDTIVLVDALFGDKPQFADWLDADPDHRLIDAANQTRHWSEALHAARPDALVFERFPPARKGRLEGARDARMVYVRSQIEHMDLVKDGVALPMLLRAVKLPVTANKSRKAPIRPI